MAEEVDAGVAMLEELGVALEDTNFREAVSAISGGDLAQAAEVVVQEPESPPIFSLTRLVFFSMLSQVMQVVPTRDFYPPLKNIVIQVDEDRLTMIGSDSTSWMIASTSAVKVERPGRVLIGAARFARVVSLAKGGMISIRCDGTMLDIESGTASWSLRVAAAQDYPALPELGDLSWVEVDRTALRRSFDGVFYAISKDTNKDFIMQVNVAGGVIAATDDSCFAQVRAGLPVELLCDIPASGVSLLVKMLDRNDAPELRIASTDYHIIAEVGSIAAPDRLIVAKLMKEFPANAKQALQAPLAENRDALTISADVLVEALRRAAPTSDEETSAVALRCGSPEAGKLQIATRNRYGDLSDEILDCSFVVDGTENPAQARTVVVSIDTLLKSVKAAAAGSPLADDAPGAGMVTLLLGQPRTKSRPSWVVVQDASKTVQAALSQVRSDWLTS